MMSGDLLEVLDDLSEDDFERFKFDLKHSCAIPGSKLHKARTWETVDLMVQKYELHGAVEVTKKILKNISRNDLVEQLSWTRAEGEFMK